MLIHLPPAIPAPKRTVIVIKLTLRLLPHSIDLGDDTTDTGMELAPLSWFQLLQVGHDKSREEHLAVEASALMCLVYEEEFTGILISAFAS